MFRHISDSYTQTSHNFLPFVFNTKVIVTPTSLTPGFVRYCSFLHGRFTHNYLNKNNGAAKIKIPHNIIALMEVTQK